MHIESKTQFRVSIKKLILLWMWWYMLITPIILYWLPLPNTLLYFGDALGFLVFIVVLRDRVVQKKYTYISNATKIWMTVFLVGGICSAIVNKISLVCCLWGIRNCGRFFLFFYAVAMYLEVEDFLSTRKIIKSIFWVSVPLCFYETYFITYTNGSIVGDMVGGIYHNFSGVSASLNIILILASADVISEYFNDQARFFKLAITIIAAVVMSAWAELKVFIVELAIIFLFNMLISKKPAKTIVLVVIGVLGLSYVVAFFTSVNARGRLAYGDIFTVEGFIDYISRDSGYDGVGDLNRLSGISTLNKGIFKNNWLQHLIGIGIGGGEYTIFFTSKFYKKYSYMHYQWFQLLWTYVENGYLGIVAMMGIILTQFKQALRIQDCWLKNYVYAIMVLMPVLFVYNLSLRSEIVGFYLYFIMAIPCLVKKKEKISYDT